MSVPQPSLAPRPVLVPSATLAMALFIATEVMFFAGLVSAFLVLRAEALVWPPPGQPRLPLGVTGLNTVLLVASGWTVQRALAATATASSNRRRSGNRFWFSSLCRGHRSLGYSAAVNPDAARNHGLGKAFAATGYSDAAANHENPQAAPQSNAIGRTFSLPSARYPSARGSPRS